MSKSRNHWKLINHTTERTKQGHTLSLYECGICGNQYKLRTYSVEQDRSRCCRPCSARKRKSEFWEITNPQGETKKVRNLYQYCRYHKLPYTRFTKAYEKNKPTSDGYKIKKLNS